MSRSSSRAIHRPMGEVVEAAMKEILPELGAAVVMAFTGGRDNAGWQATDPNLDRPRVNRGHEAKRR